MARSFDVGAIEDLPPGTHRIVRAGNREVGVFNIRGDLHAIPNLCPHQRGPLCAGRVTGTLVRRRERGFVLEWAHQGEVVTCPWHSMEFHVPTGRCVAFSDIRLRKFDVRVENGRVIVTS